MNWREAWSGHSKAFRPAMEKSYGFPNTDLFPDNAGNGNGTQWFDYLAKQGLRTYFNDHPFPAMNGTACSALRRRWPSGTRASPSGWTVA